MSTIWLLSFFIGCKSTTQLHIYKSDSLIIQQLTNKTFLHVSYLEIESFGKVACNGMIVIDDGKAIIFDTPTSDKVSTELINRVEDDLDSKVIGVVVTHFHVDCLGGLKAFHDMGVRSYAHNSTIRLAGEKGSPQPQHGFDNSLDLQVGNTTVTNEYFGEGHTVDNIVSYVKGQEVLFGGCLIKSVGAGKGNLADANVDEWSNTVARVKGKYVSAEIIIPGHGKSGSAELLDYTIDMFKDE